MAKGNIGDTVQAGILFIMKDGEKRNTNDIRTAFYSTFNISKEVQNIMNGRDRSRIGKSIADNIYFLKNDGLLEELPGNKKRPTYQITAQGRDDPRIASAANITSEYFSSYYGSSEKVPGEMKETKAPITGYNLIISGIPGSGKSYSIDSLMKKMEIGHSVRTVFHPEYTNTDFVGQIVPFIGDSSSDKKNKKAFDFAPGPFTRALKIAREKPNERVALIIEELNRGDSAAIFGEIFQLLDRKADGESEYGIDSYFISKYLDIDEQIRIPPNMFLFATMNTSDQNVFTMDTAFTRRWKFKRMVNDISECEWGGWFIPGTEETWSAFVKTINKKITGNSKIQNSEDKQLGAFFVSKEYLCKTLQESTENPLESLENKKEFFANKVLGYLWNDVFRFDRHSLFTMDCKTMEDVLKTFKTKGLSVFNENYNTD